MSHPRSGGALSFQNWLIDCDRRDLRFADASIAIGSRAFEILAILARSAGRLVTKDDLIDIVWSGIAIEENTLQVHISAIRRALGKDRDLLKTISGRGYTLGGEWLFLPSSPNPESTSIEAIGRRVLFTTNLPAARSPLIGREDVLRELLHALSAYRAVTLTGLGGIGKTQLAIELARRARSAFDDSVVLVELATLQSPSLVASAAARLLSLNLGSQEIDACAVAEAIGKARLLLLLDNCEHVIDSAAALADSVLKRCPHVTILATSREALRIAGEYVAAIPPLAVPESNLRDRDLLLQRSAVELFVSRTGALRPHFVPSLSDMLDIGAICRRLDGIPLAVELAAARAANLGLETVLRRLDERFDLLTGGNRSQLRRHQTLRATLDWSYDLLPEAERLLLCYLALFPAGFSLEAVVAMLDESLSRLEIVEALHNLVAKSLVSLDSSSQHRWRLLETTRAYGFEKLASNGLAAHAAKRHALFYRNLIVRQPNASHSVEDLSRFASEIGNVQAALDWAFSSDGDAVIGVELTAAFTPIWMQLLAFAECSNRIEAALERFGPQSKLDRALQAQLYVALGFALLNTTGSAHRMEVALNQGLELARDLGDLELQLKAIWTLWSYNLNSGRYGRAMAVAHEYIGIARRTGSDANEDVGHRLLGAATHFFGQQEDAHRELTLSLEGSVRDRIDGASPMWFLLNQSVLSKAMLARVLLLQGQIARSRALADACFDEAMAEKDKLSVAYALRNAVCPIALMTQDLANARRATTALLELVTREGIAFWKSWTSCLSGQLLMLEGNHAEGIAQLRQGLAARARNGWLMRNPEFLGSLAEGLLATGQSSEALAEIEMALNISEQGQQLWCKAELLRIKGEILFAIAPQDTTASDLVFSHGLSIAKFQGCALYELKVAASWSRILIETDRRSEATDILSAASAHFDIAVDIPALDFARGVLAGNMTPGG